MHPFAYGQVEHDNNAWLPPGRWSVMCKATHHHNRMREAATCRAAVQPAAIARLYPTPRK
eukprot:scaffold32077_cov14-Tisochrysis_lutea.AAC.2